MVEGDEEIIPSCVCEVNFGLPDNGNDEGGMYNVMFMY